MKKKWFISKDSEYYKDNEDAIKLESCPEGGGHCKLQMVFMNENLLLARKLIENKDYTRAVSLIKDAFDSTFDLKEKQCQACADLFRESISSSLNLVIFDLEEMTKGLFGIKSFNTDLKIAKRILQELKDNMNSGGTNLKLE